MKRNLILMSALFAGSMIVNDGFGCMESLRRFCLNRTTSNNDFSWVDDDNESFSISDDYFETESEIDETENSKTGLNDLYKEIKDNFLVELKTAKNLEDVVRIYNSSKNYIDEKYHPLYDNDTIDSLNKILKKKIYNTVKKILGSNPTDAVNDRIGYISSVIRSLANCNEDVIIENRDQFADCLLRCPIYFNDCCILLYGANSSVSKSMISPIG